MTLTDIIAVLERTPLAPEERATLTRIVREAPAKPIDPKKKGRPPNPFCQSCGRLREGDNAYEHTKIINGRTYRYKGCMACRRLKKKAAPPCECSHKKGIHKPECWHRGQNGQPDCECAKYRQRRTVA